jgi:hypothetical protein
VHAQPAHGLPPDNQLILQLAQTRATYFCSRACFRHDMNIFCHDHSARFGASGCFWENPGQTSRLGPKKRSLATVLLLGYPIFSLPTVLVKMTHLVWTSSHCICMNVSLASENRQARIPVLVAQAVGQSRAGTLMCAISHAPLPYPHYVTIPSRLLDSAARTAELRKHQHEHIHQKRIANLVAVCAVAGTDIAVGKWTCCRLLRFIHGSTHIAPVEGL